MNNFETAVNLTLEKEGILSDHKDDAGGLTKYGISQAAYPGLDIASLTKADAIAIYKRDYWDKAQCEEIPYPLDIMLFDTAVNHGVTKAVKILHYGRRCHRTGNQSRCPSSKKQHLHGFYD